MTVKNSEKHNLAVFPILNRKNVDECIKWIKKPVKVDFKPNERMIKEKSKTIIMDIDDIELESKEQDFSYLEPKILKVWKKIKSSRQSGLESQSGEFSLGNLVFKLLRRNGYIKKIMDLKRKLYDKQFK